MMPELDSSGKRDRSRPLVIPRVKPHLGDGAHGRIGTRHCALCGRPIPVGKDAERYGRRVYCSAQCHKEARRINAAENAKKRHLSGLPRMQSAIPESARAEPRECIICHVTKPATEFVRDASRPSGVRAHCRECQRQINGRKYAARREERQRAARERNRAWRKVEKGERELPQPPTEDMSARRLLRAIDNLREILSALPAEARPVLAEALDRGRINGMLFEDKAGCGCLWGTIGRGLGWGVSEEHEWARRFRHRTCAEIDLFGRIAPGDTPATNPYAEICRKIVGEMAG